jgi:hypothetical protein
MDDDNYYLIKESHNLLDLLLPYKKLITSLIEFIKIGSLALISVIILITASVYLIINFFLFISPVLPLLTTSIINFLNGSDVLYTVFGFSAAYALKSKVDKLNDKLNQIPTAKLKTVNGLEIPGILMHSGSISLEL